MQALSSMVIKYREDADEFSALFADRQLPASLKHLSSLETYELHLPEELIGLSGSALPMLRRFLLRVLSFSDLWAIVCVCFVCFVVCVCERVYCG